MRPAGKSILSRRGSRPPHQMVIGIERYRTAEIPKVGTARGSHRLDPSQNVDPRRYSRISSSESFSISFSMTSAGLVPLGQPAMLPRRAQTVSPAWASDWVRDGALALLPSHLTGHFQPLDSYQTAQASRLSRIRVAHSAVRAVPQAALAYASASSPSSANVRKLSRSSMSSG